MEYFLQISHQTYVYVNRNMSQHLVLAGLAQLELECRQITIQHFFPDIQYLFPGCILNHA